MASQQEMASQIVTLNQTVIEMTQKLQQAQNGLTQAQQRILQLEQARSSAQAPGGGDKKRMIDPKLLAPDAFIKEADFREWAEEFEEAVERYSDEAARVMRENAYSEEEVSLDALSMVPDAEIKDICDDEKVA